MAAAFYADKGDFIGVDLLQALAVADGDEAIFCAVEDISMAVHMAYPPVGAQLVTQDEFYGKKGEKAFHHFHEIVIGRVENKVTGFVVGRDFSGKAAADAAAVNEDMVLGVLGKQLGVYKLHIVEYIVFAAFARAFTETAVVHQHYIVIIPVKIAGVFGPAFYAAGITVEVKDKSLGLFSIKMKPVDARAGSGIKKQFFKRDIIFKLEVLSQLFGLEYEPVLQEPNQHNEDGHTESDIKEYSDRHPERYKLICKAQLTDLHPYTTASI